MARIKKVIEEVVTPEPEVVETPVQEEVVDPNAKHTGYNPEFIYE